MAGVDLKVELRALAQTGCQGNAADYTAWLRYAGKLGDSAVDSIASALKSLAAEGPFRTHSEFQQEYLATEPEQLPDKVSYSVSSRLEDSPIQMVRSRLDCFLRQHKVSESHIIDLSIATTEAMENAVKYTSGGDITVSYSIADNVFNIRVVNRIRDARPEDDIEAGKYSSSVTLMRGMMVMVKLFDEMDIDIQEEKGSAVFTGMKKLS